MAALKKMQVRLLASPRLAVGLGLALCCVPRSEAAVVFTCSVTATSINFGTYNPLLASPVAATGSWSVVCTASGSGSGTVSGTLSLSTGLSGTYATRHMLSGINVLNYNIYLTPAYAQIFGNGTGGTFAPSDSGTVTAGQQYLVNGSMYGLIPAMQDVAAGNYADAIVVTVAY